MNALLLLGLGKNWEPQQRLRATGKDLPRVDVFCPCYGEGLDIITDTLMAMLDQDYPKDRYRIVILDDGGSETVRQLVIQLKSSNPDAQLYYAARGAAVKIHSKAANIAFGMDFVKTLPGGAAPYFGVLDIDMITGRDYIRGTVPFLEQDEKVALAGAPQKFYNLPQGFCLAPRFHLDSDVIQRLFDAKGKAVCQGTGYIARRSAFEHIGGFPTMVKQEDSFIVTIILQAYGFKARLVEEEHQHGMNALTYTDMAKLQTKWMSGIIHGYSLFAHPIISDKPFGTKLSSIIPILHMTLLRFWMMISLPMIVAFSRCQVVPSNGNSLLISLILSFIAYSSAYLLNWTLSIAANDTISLDDGVRLWNLPYQLKGVLWLVKHQIFGETKMAAFKTTGADVAHTRKLASKTFIGRLWRTVTGDGGWMHLTFFVILAYVVSLTLNEALPLQTSSYYALLTSIAYPPFAKIILDCFYNAFVPIQYVLSPDPNARTREDFLTRDVKTGIARPKKDCITPPTPAFWGTAGITGLTWLYFGLAPAWTALFA
jgi:cellulose synthase/poly-beta-1,6-N-acetylglucosamine synthase-like glycosyltransferase